MASTHKHIRSSTASKRPTTAIADGQIALNTNNATPGLFFKDSTGATIIKVGPVHVGTTAPNATPAAGGSSGNSTGEVWLDTSLTPPGVKIWNGSAWVNGTPAGSTTVQGLLELATNAETQTGSDTARAVTPAGLQSKVSDSVSTTSSTTIASSTAVKTAYDLANAALPKAGGTVTGNLEIGTTGSLTFEGATADAFETTLAVTDPTADRTITLPDVSGNVVTTGDTGTVTSTMIADGTIVNDDVNASAAIAYSKLALTGSIVDADVSASAEIAVSKLADGAARQLLQTDAAGTGVEWTDNVDIPGTLDVTGAAVFDSTANIAGNLTVDTNTLYVDATNNRVGIGTTSPSLGLLEVSSTNGVTLAIKNTTGTTAGTEFCQLTFNNTSNSSANFESAKIKAISTNGGTNLAHLTFENSGTERARIDSSGRLLVGTSSAPTVSTGSLSRLVVQGFIGGDSNDGIMSLQHGGTPGSGGNIGALQFTKSDGAVYATVGAQADGTSGAGDYPGRLVFSTTADGASSPTEQMRISQNGNLSIQNGAFQFTTAHLFIGGSRMPYNVGSLTMQWSDSTGRVSITTSTRLLKKNIEDSPYGIAAVKALQPRTYTISDKEGQSEKSEIGFIADEVTEVIPEIVPWSRKSLVTGNEEDEELIPVSVQYDRISVVLVKALQEAIVKIETLEAKVAALEAS